MDKLGELRKILMDRLHQQGWDNARQFTLGSGQPYSVETTRRAFHEADKKLDASTVAIIAKYLNYTPDEIRGLLREYTDDTELWPLIGSQTVKFGVMDRAILSAVQAILEAKPDLTANLAEHLNLLASVAGVDVSQHTKVLLKRGKK